MDCEELLDPKAYTDRPRTLDLLHELGTPQGSFFHRFAAGNRSTPVETLSELTWSKDTNVLILLAGNPNLPAKSVERLAERHQHSMVSESDSRVDFLLASHPNLTERGMWALVSAWASSDLDIIWKIVTRLDVTAQVLQYAMKRSREDPGIFRHVLSHPAYPERLVVDLSYKPEYRPVLQKRYGNLPEWEEISALSHNWTRTVGELLAAATLVRR